jgi:hypothetical protein
VLADEVEGERRELIVRRRRASVGLYIHSAAWAKQQEKERGKETDKRKRTTIELRSKGNGKQ